MTNLSVVLAVVGCAVLIWVMFSLRKSSGSPFASDSGEISIKGDVTLKKIPFVDVTSEGHERVKTRYIYEFVDVEGNEHTFSGAYGFHFQDVPEGSVPWMEFRGKKDDVDHISFHLNPGQEIIELEED